MIERYAVAAMDGELDRVRAAQPGGRNDALNTAAFNLGQLVAAGALPVEQVERELIDAALSTGLGLAETRATVRSGLRGGTARPRNGTPATGLDRLAGFAELLGRPPAPAFLDYEQRWARLDAAARAVADSLGPPGVGEAEPERVPSRFAATLLARSGLGDLPSAEPLIDGILSRRSAALLVGSTGIGKTFVALSWACAVGTGTAWLGHPVRRCPVLYVVGEGATGLHARVSAWEQAWGVKVADGDVTFSLRPDSLSSARTWVEMADEARDLRVGLVVLDTFSSLAPDADETKDAATMVRRLGDLGAITDGTALLVHHPGWSDNGRSRGGYQLEANVDEVLLLTGVADSDVVELKRKKCKDGQDGQRLWLRRRPLAGSVVIETATGQDVEVPLRARILVVLRDMGEVGITGPQLMAELGLSDERRSTLSKAMQGLVRDGTVVAEGSRGRSRYFLCGP